MKGNLTMAMSEDEYRRTLSRIEAAVSRCLEVDYEAAKYSHPFRHWLQKICDYSEGAAKRIPSCED